MKILAGLSLVLSLLLPASAAALTVERARAIATQVGVPEDVTVGVAAYDGADNDYEFNGGFTPAGTYCQWMFCEVVGTTIVVYAGPKTPEDVLVNVLLHEIAHYYQWKAGTLSDPMSEWDADVWALNAGCTSFGMSAGVFNDWLRIVHFSGIIGSNDEDHGVSALRVKWGIEHATECAPLLPTEQAA